MSVCTIVECARPHYGRGYCRLHYDRWRTHGDPTAISRLRTHTLKERLDHWSEVRGECREYTGRLDRYGYGQMTVNGGIITAHRVSYMEYIGAIPSGLVVRHKCDNRACVLPDHLELGTHGDNARDRVERGRSLTGELNPSVKITAEDAAEIRARAGRGEKHRDIAAEFGIGQSQVGRIFRGESWAHVA